MRNVLTNFFRKSLFRETITDQGVFEETEVYAYDDQQASDLENSFVIEYTRLSRKLELHEIEVQDVCDDILDGRILLREAPPLERSLVLVALGRTLNKHSYLPNWRR
jgi:hypothetical protein